jgi:hypothetical protein
MKPEETREPFVKRNLEPSSLLRQAPEHYKPPTFKAINYIYVICIVALSGRS